jgi:hypothetical protein
VDGYSAVLRIHCCYVTRSFITIHRWTLFVATSIQYVHLHNCFFSIHLYLLILSCLSACLIACNNLGLGKPSVLLRNNWISPWRYDTDTFLALDSLAEFCSNLYTQGTLVSIFPFTTKTEDTHTACQGPCRDEPSVRTLGIILLICRPVYRRQGTVLQRGCRAEGLIRRAVVEARRSTAALRCLFECPWCCPGTPWGDIKPRYRLIKIIKTIFVIVYFLKGHALGGPQSRSGRCREEKNPLFLLGI